MDLVSVIAHANQIAKDAVEAEVGDDVTPSQARFLLALSGEEGISQTHISHATNIDRSTLADVSWRLVKKGYISRKRTSSDARRYAVSLTEKGREKVREIKAARRRIETRIRQSIDGVDGLSIRPLEAAE